jgi:1-acyl-sn-glycerol-3-phosphate acyltransferase
LWLLVALGPVVVPVVAIRDAVRGSGGAGLRALGILGAHLLAEVVGLTATAVTWLALRGHPRRLVDATYALQRRWGAFLFGAIRRLLGLDLTVKGDDAARAGPLLVFVRHASHVDTLLPLAVLGARHGLRPRYVLKRELLADPCLDVVGHRLPNYFVERGGDAHAEAEAVGRLAAALGPRDAVVIYPEGTLFTEEKLAAARERIGRSPAKEKAARDTSGLRRVLPPRMSGPLALLRNAPGVDVLFVAHAGLEPYASLRDLWARRARGGAIRVRMWRVPATSIPTDPEAQARWLDARWAEVDSVVQQLSR